MHFVRFVGEVCEKTFYSFQRQFFLQKYVYTRRDHKEVLKTPLDIMSNLIYIFMNQNYKPIAWLHEQPQTPPLSQSRPMPSIGAHCHELRINDEDKTWGLFYRIDVDAIIVILWIEKKTNKTPDEVLELCRKRLKSYDSRD